MGAPEKAVKARVRRGLASAGAYVLPVVTGGMMPLGTPDILACHRGRFLAIECKASAGARPTAWQARRLAEIGRAGGRTAVIHAGNVEEELCRLLG
jgi:Holliday junction resolvase